MKPRTPSSYRDAGVDIDLADRAKRRIKRLARKTFTPAVLTEIGGFGGLFRLDRKGLRQPVLVSSVDGVGTKLKVAFATGIHHTVGKDLVCHCVNDILVQGAVPLFFMDYIATGRMEPDVIARIVEGLAAGCREAGCALLGGETAEMPGFYADGEYDLAGFVVGVVDKSKILDGRRIRPGDTLVGLPSAGLHTNGYSLARKLLFDVAGYDPGSFDEELGETVGQALLRPHLSYLKALQPLTAAGALKGMAHITGGGLTDNIPRVLPANCRAVIRLGSWSVPPIFGLLQKLGSIGDEEMLRTFNMGIGMVVIVGRQALPKVEQHLHKVKQPYFRIGEVREGGARVVYET
ncbi:MAG: phosphoribosylformylglycinamidine cyclo-ligase [Acidobacteriota bacterium]